MIIDFRARSMKSEPPGSGRQPSGPFSGDMSKALTNGDRRPSEAVLRQVSLVAAYHDHISCAKSAELLDAMPCETDHLYAHCGDDAPDDSEQDPLRAIIVLHTDLIQHQQELIADRDRQIDELRAQRDELQEHLHRFQQTRRVSVGCQTDEPVVDVRSRTPLLSSPLPAEPQSPRAAPEEEAGDTCRASLREEFLAEPPSSVPEVQDARNEPETAAAEVSGPTTESTRRQPPPHRPEGSEPSRPAAPEPARRQPPPHRPEGPESSRPPPEPARRQPPPQRPEAARPAAMPESVRVGPPAAEEGAERAQEAPPEPPAAPVQSSSQEAVAPPEAAPDAAARKAARKRPSSVLCEERSRVLWTDRPYPSWPRPPPEEAVEPIEVPTWRVRTVPTAYSMEGTENLDDEVFIKRHDKPERDERRRKKWDMQRLREEQQMERLRRKQLRSQPEAERPPACPRSFCGHLRDVHHVEVVEALPVVAFGQPIPDLEPREFCVPWLARHGEQSRTADGRSRAKHRKQQIGHWR